MTKINDLSEPSKSARKREMIALQKLGETLVQLPEASLLKIPLDPVLLEAIQEARGISQREAKRRQLQYIGKLMRSIDATPIQAALLKIELKSRESKARHHQIERWRDKLINEDDKILQEFLTLNPHISAQEIRQLVRNAKKSLPGAEKALFQFIRKTLEDQT